ncbi:MULTISPECIES: hypothetical protein [Arthrobacter]|nr:MULTISPECIES: hypothetical protein [Arthrobacter]
MEEILGLVFGEWSKDHDALATVQNGVEHNLEPLGSTKNLLDAG